VNGTRYRCRGGSHSGTPAWLAGQSKPPKRCTRSILNPPYTIEVIIFDNYIANYEKGRSIENAA
jgi:hypothetical protein